MNLPAVLTLSALLVTATVVAVTSQPTHSQAPSLATASPSSDSSGQFVYPNAQTINQDQGMVNLQSEDNPTTITNWYQDKIKQLGFTITTSIQTNTNGNLSNKLIGNNKDQFIDIEITKQYNQPKTIIIIRHE
ncbi:hypothetical protein HY385_00600 [Candidatus Daviesbacteria bacterium]|nr:hypothetical protein [Candidatus Daviesbacteria bacterium]